MRTIALHKEADEGTTGFALLTMVPQSLHISLLWTNRMKYSKLVNCICYYRDLWDRFEVEVEELFISRNEYLFWRQPLKFSKKRRIIPTRFSILKILFTVTHVWLKIRCNKLISHLFLAIWCIWAEELFIMVAFFCSFLSPVVWWTALWNNRFGERFRCGKYWIFCSWLFEVIWKGYLR